MGYRGPIPKPTQLKVLEGNPGKRPLPANEPKPKPVAPKCPSWLDKEAKREWRRVVPELSRLGLLTVVDGTALAAYCQAYSKWVEAEKFMQKHGMIFKTPSGYIQQVPQVAIAQKYLLIVRDFCREFGLTPSSRSRMTFPTSGEADEFEDFLNGRY
jgi:P27 family predicted phage terminase small subunit